MTARERWLVVGVGMASGGFLAVVRLVSQGAASPGPERTERLLLAAISAVVVVIGASTWAANADAVRGRWLGVGLAGGVLIVLPLLLLALPEAVEALVSAIDRGAVPG